jgi:hypothetical protein
MYYVFKYIHKYMHVYIYTCHMNIIYINNKGRGVAGGTGITSNQKSINDYFKKSLEQSSLLYDDINRGSLSRGNSGGKSRGNLRNGTEYSGNFENDMSPENDDKVDKKRKLSSELNADLNGDSIVSDFNNQMNERFSSTMDNSYIEKQKILSSQSMGNFTNISKKSNFSNLPLPPIRLQYINTLEKKRKMLMKNGFDEAFGRATPRCLRNESSNNPIIPSGFGGNR